MDGDDEDPDSAGPVHPSVFYGFWPRFAVDEDAGGIEDEEPGPGIHDGQA